MKKLIVLIIALTFTASLNYAQTKDKKEISKTSKTTFSVKGMTCSGCVTNVENKLKDIDGVMNYKVDLKTNSAKVEFDPQKTSEKVIADVMNKTNYKFSKEKSKKKIEIKNPSKTDKSK